MEVHDFRLLDIPGKHDLGFRNIQFPIIRRSTIVRCIDHGGETLNCTITVKKKGRLKKDWTGTIKEAIKDWDTFYRAVFNHVKNCDKCDANEVLQAYWQLRQKPKHKGRTSAGLAKLACQYGQIGADVELVKLIVSRSGYVVRYAHIFNNRELYDAICEDIVYFTNFGVKWGLSPDGAEIYNQTIYRIESYLLKRKRPFLRGVALVFESQLTPAFEDVEKMAVIAEVTLS